jgi:hypothetical protein
VEERKGKERLLRGKRIKAHHINTCEDSIMKPTKLCLQKGEEKRGVEI